MNIARILLITSAASLFCLFLITFISYVSAWPVVLSVFAILAAFLIILWVRYSDDGKVASTKKNRLRVLVFIWPMFFVFALTILLIFAGPLMVEALDPGYEGHFIDVLIYMIIILTYGATFVLIPWLTLNLIINIYRNVNTAHRLSCLREILSEETDSSLNEVSALSYVTGCIDSLQVALLKYTRCADDNWRQIEFGLDGFRQDIDVVFSCISEALWNDYYQTYGIMPMNTLSTMATDSDTRKNLPRMTPERLRKWVSELDDTLFTLEGRLILPNNTTMSKLKSFIRRTREVLEESRYQEICENQVKLVSQYHEKRELVSSQRKDVVIGLARQVLIAVASAAIGIFFGTQIA